MGSFRRRHSPSVTGLDSMRSKAFIIFVLYTLIASIASATDIKWTANKDNDNDPAKSAPRSQRYWDENKIERPDYAKTDAEIAAERGESSSSQFTVFLVGGILLGIAVGMYVREAVIIDGHRLGSEKSKRFSFWSSSTEAEEKARKARLARFEEKQD